MNIFVKILLFFTISVFSIVFIRLLGLTIINHEYYKQQAISNATQVQNIISPRGEIYDRNKKILANNQYGFSIALSPKLKMATLQENIAWLIKNIDGLDSKKILKTYLNKNSVYIHEPIVVVNYIDHTKIQGIYASAQKMPYIHIHPALKRKYAYKKSASHVIGYVGHANEDDIVKNPISQYTNIIGKSGIEAYYNTYLQGDLEQKVTLVNALLQQQKIIKNPQKPIQHNLTLTLDIDLQTYIDKIMEEHNGSVIVMDVHNGEILAAGSYPEYDLNHFVDGISYTHWNELLENPYLPLINKISNGLYPPGSIIKMGMGLAFLEYANINESTIIDTPCFIELGGRKFRDWRCGHSSANFTKSIRESVDVYYYKLSQRTGINNIANVMNTLGFGKTTGVDLPSESRGVVPTPEWKLKMKNESWVAGDLLNLSIGQGYFLVTPIQITRYVALLASGKLVTPHFAKAKNEEILNFPIQDVLNETQKQKLQAVHKGMYEACNLPSGTAFSKTRGSKISLSCKTGTAQTSEIPQLIKQRMREQDMEYFKRSQAWIVAFTPSKNPRYVITVLIEHGGNGGRGGGILVNIANKMYELGYFKEN